MNYILTDEEQAKWIIDTHDEYGVKKAFEVYGDDHGPDKLEIFKQFARQAWLDKQVREKSA